MTTPSVTKRQQQPVDVAIERLAARQLGLVSRSQALRLGATDRMIRWRLASGRWLPATGDAVFRLGGAPASWEQTLLATCLAYGDGAVASHHAVAALWRIPEIGIETMEVTVPRGRRRKRGIDATVHYGDLRSADITRIGSVPATTVARMFVDLAGDAPFAAVEVGLDDALRRKLTTIDRIRRAIERGGRRRGIEDLRDLLNDRDNDAIPESVLETRLYRRIIEDGLPVPKRQYVVRDDGRFIARVDLAYPEHKLAVEAEGFEPHAQRAQFDRDRERANDLTLLGWRIIVVTWPRLRERPDEVSESIRRALRALAP